MEANNKLREALRAIWKEVYLYAIEEDKQDFAHLQEAMLEDPPEYKDLRNSFFAIAHLVDAALAEPVKNCEVGTVAEQAERFDAFCQSNMQFYKDMFGYDDEGRLDGWDCRKDCPVGRMIDSGTAVPDRCQLAWAQMPYEAEKEGVEK